MSFLAGITLQFVWNALITILVPIVAILLKTYVDRLLDILEEKTNIEVEEKYRQRLEEVIDRGLAMLVSGKAFTASQDRAQAIHSVVNYVSDTVPDTVQRLGANKPALQKRVEAQLDRMVKGR